MADDDGTIGSVGSVDSSPPPPPPSNTDTSTTDTSSTDTAGQSAAASAPQDTPPVGDTTPSSDTAPAQAPKDVASISDSAAVGQAKQPPQPHNKVTVSEGKLDYMTGKVQDKIGPDGQPVQHNGARSAGNQKEADRLGMDRGDMRKTIEDTGADPNNVAERGTNKYNGNPTERKESLVHNEKEPSRFGKFQGDYEVDPKTGTRDFKSGQIHSTPDKPLTPETLKQKGIPYDPKFDEKPMTPSGDPPPRMRPGGAPPDPAAPGADPNVPKAPAGATDPAAPAADPNAPKAPAADPAAPKGPAATDPAAPKTSVPQVKPTVPEASPSTAAKLAKYGMKGLEKAALPLALASGAYELATSNDKPRTAAELGGGLAGGIAGAEGGALAGAALGSVVPIVGTAVGGVVGGIVGGIGGSLIGSGAASWLYGKMFGS